MRTPVIARKELTCAALGSAVAMRYAAGFYCVGLRFVNLYATDFMCVVGQATVPKQHRSYRQAG